MIETSGPHSVEVGSTITITPMTVDGEDTSYTFASGDESIATVDGSGTVTGVAAGETDITVTGADTGASADHVVVVIAPAETGEPFVTVTGDFAVLVNETSQLTATTGNGEDSSYTWSSSDENVFQVDETGLATAVGLGQATITATGDDTGASASIGMISSLDIPIYNAWIESGHADRSADAFRHWDEDGEIPENCARCHSTLGYQDYLGADGSEFGEVNQPAALGTVVNCNACHNSVTPTLDQVTFPSGVTITDAGAEARCMTCHQGRGSTDDVRADIDEAGVGEDEVGMDLSFSNIHYYAAGATLLAGQVRGAYQYEGQVYDWRFRHVEDFDQCQECHNPHSLELQIDACADCHEGVASVEDVRDIRMVASLNQDYDGDGDTTEGIRAEIVGESSLSSKLYEAIQTYASETAETADICYGSGYPYFFLDTDGSGGFCDEAEDSFPNRYNTWTPRLLKAAYNYQVAQVDPGAYAHNAKYTIQALFDSITDLNSAITNQVDMSNAVRNDQGHFNGAGEAARHWDEDATVSSRCSQCHSGKEGYEFYVEFGVGLEVPEQANGLECGLCHTDLTASPPPVISVESVELPSGATFSTIFDDDDDGESSSNMCGVCHMGRQSGLSVDDAIGSAGDTDILDGQGFTNPHYKPAYATRVGSEGMVGYQYDGQSYAPAFVGHPGGDECAACHQPQNNNHSFSAQDIAAACNGCHPGAGTDIEVINGAFGTERGVDYDGNGTNDNLVDEIAGMAANVYTQLQTTAAATSVEICYADDYPYFFVDTDASGGFCSDDEANFGNQYRGNFTPQILRGAYNYQLSQVEPGGWAHNFDYMGQLLYDSFVDLGGDPQLMTRPAVQ